MRLIDADKARETAAIDLVVHHLDRQPTIDAVPVVRCKDCVYGTLCENMAGADYVDCGMDDQATRLPHDFCSYGERREDT